MTSHIKRLALIAGSLSLIACSNTQLPQPFTASSNGPSTPGARVFSQSTNDRQASADASGQLPAAAITSAPPAAAEEQQIAPPITAISPAVKATVTSPTTAPLTKSVGASLSQYQTVGAVVTNVSGTPIYADKVIAQLTPLLKSEAKQRDFDQYRSIAHSEVDKQVAAMINNELEYAAAEQGLGKDEKDFAELYTTQWRQQQITEAGGSLELARKKAAADGIDFDQSVEDEYRKVFVQVFYQKKIFPKVQVTADDIRRYYDQHQRDEFTQVDQARFRVIKITTKQMGGRAQAIDKIKQLHDQAARGDDFARLAGEINHDPTLMKTHGLLSADGWVQKGSYAVTPVEDAVWKLQPGQVTDVIEDKDAFYIAKLEDRKLGHTRAFEDEDVQNAIRDKLTKSQMAVRRDQLRKTLMENSVIYPNPPETGPVMEIALQKYSAWAGK